MSNVTQARAGNERLIQLLTLLDFCHKTLALDEALLQQAMREYADVLSQERRRAA